MTGEQDTDTIEYFRPEPGWTYGTESSLGKRSRPHFGYEDPEAKRRF